MILTDADIIEAVKTKAVDISPFDEKQVQPASYDFRVGKFGCSTTSKKKVNIEETGYILLHPGDFGVVEVLEDIRLGDQYAARFGLRSKFARKGLIATTGVQIDPGYEGKLIIGITNLTPKPISLAYKDDFVTVEFHKLENPVAHPYVGPYHKKTGIGPEEVEFIMESDGMALSEVLTTLRSLSTNVGEMTINFNKMSANMTAFKWLIGVLVAFLAIFVAIIAIK